MYTNTCQGVAGVSPPHLSVQSSEKCAEGAAGVSPSHPGMQCLGSM